MAARWLQVGALLARPIAWLVIRYLGSLAGLLIASFWSVDALSGELIKGFTFDNFKELSEQSRLPGRGLSGRSALPRP